MDDYDVKAAFADIEKELLESMMRNLKHHRAEEKKEGKEWIQWQVEQLRGLEEYKRIYSKKLPIKFKDINREIRLAILKAHAIGKMAQEEGILNAIKKGFALYKKSSDKLRGEFFKVNNRQMDALLNAVNNDMEKAESAILRRVEDAYRKTIFNSAVYAASGATYEKAVDMAVKDFLERGIDCVVYKGGRQVNIKDYAEMALRTAKKRAYLAGEGTKRQEFGIHTVIVNKRGNPCPKCLPWVGKILIDDVWSGGTTKEAEELGYHLVSEAMNSGLYHPNCRDSHTTYFEGISTPPDSKWKKEELTYMEEKNKTDQKQNHAKRQVEKYDRLAEYSLDPENKEKYKRKACEWQQKSNEYKGINEM